MAAPGSSEVEYIVIGGGFSGISAAEELAKSGKDFIVLEDLDRLGGRNYSFEVKDPITGEIVPGMEGEHGSQYVGCTQERLFSIVTNGNGDPSGKHELSPEAKKQALNIQGMTFQAWMEKNHPDEVAAANNVPSTVTDPAAQANFNLPPYVVNSPATRSAFKDPLADMITAVLRNNSNVMTRYAYDKSPLGISGVPAGIGAMNVLAILIKTLQLTVIERSINVVDPKESDLGNWGSAIDLDKINSEEWLKKDWWMPPTACDTFRMAIQSLLSIECTEISPLYLLWYCACNGGFMNEVNNSDGGPQQYWLRCGFKRVLEFLSDSFASKIQYQRRVTQVTLKAGGGAEVTHQKSGGGDPVTISCKKLIVAVSPSTCQKINFPAELKATWDPLFINGMGRTYKCQTYYKEEWWNKVPKDMANPDKGFVGYQGYGGGASWPVLWSMDASANDAKGVYRPAVMTFTVGDLADELGAKIANAKTVKEKQDILIGYLCPEISYMYTGTRDYEPALHPEFIASYFWDPNSTETAGSFIGGGPNSIMKPGDLTGAAGAVLTGTQSYQDTVFFAAAETTRNIRPTLPDTFSNGKYSDNRMDLGYMNGGLTAGTFLAQVAMGTPVPPPTKAPADELTTRVNAFLQVVFENMAAEAGPDSQGGILHDLIEAIKAVLTDLHGIGNVFKDLAAGHWIKALSDLAVTVIGRMSTPLAITLGKAIGLVFALFRGPGWGTEASDKLVAWLDGEIGKFFSGKSNEFAAVGNNGAAPTEQGK